MDGHRAAHGAAGAAAGARISALGLGDAGWRARPWGIVPACLARVPIVVQPALQLVRAFGVRKAYSVGHACMVCKGHVGTLRWTGLRASVPVECMIMLHHHALRKSEGRAGNGASLRSNLNPNQDAHCLEKLCPQAAGSACAAGAAALCAAANAALVPRALATRDHIFFTGTASCAALYCAQLLAAAASGYAAPRPKRCMNRDVCCSVPYGRVRAALALSRSAIRRLRSSVAAAGCR